MAPRTKTENKGGDQGSSSGSRVNSPEANAARIATRQANASVDIDYSEGRDKETFAPAGSRTSLWVLKLNKLVRDVNKGKAKSGAFYKIGAFTTASTAQSTKKRIEIDLAGQLQGEVELMAERVAEGSELYAAAFIQEGWVGDEDE